MLIGVCKLSEFFARSRNAFVSSLSPLSPVSQTRWTLSFSCLAAYSSTGRRSCSAGRVVLCTKTTSVAWPLVCVRNRNSLPDSGPEKPSALKSPILSPTCGPEVTSVAVSAKTSMNEETICFPPQIEWPGSVCGLLCQRIIREGSTSMNRFGTILILATALVPMAWSQPEKPAEPDILIADFEGPDYGAWKTTGTAFGTGPARGTLPNQMPVTGYLGKGLVNSYLGGDASTGTLTSPPLKIERAYINFLIGGGKFPGKTCINLLVGGKIVRSATGPNDEPGGSERLDWHSWDVKEFVGKEAVIEIVDRATGGW